MGRRKSKFKIRAPKKIWVRVTPLPPWIELPEDVTANILRRLGTEEIIKTAQKVCTTWRKVCRDPSMWRVIHLFNPEHYMEQYDQMCRFAVDCSQGQLVELNINYFGDDHLMNYVADRSPLIKHLTLEDCIDISGEGLIAAVKRLPDLEELHLNIMQEFSAEDITNIGASCPKLKSFSFNYRGVMQPFPETFFDDGGVEEESNEIVVAIAKTMPNLLHLRLFASLMTNEGLEAILVGCPHLESLDIRQCQRIDLQKEGLGKRCSEQIKHVKYPSDSTSDISWVTDDYADAYSPIYSGYDSPYDDYGYLDYDLEDYDDFCNPFNDFNFFGEDGPSMFDHFFI